MNNLGLASFQLPQFTYVLRIKALSLPDEKGFRFVFCINMRELNPPPILFERIALPMS